MIRHAIVAGGGIAGHSAALALLQAGIAVTVLEARPDDNDLGSFLRLNPNGLDALNAIDVLDPVVDASFPIRHVDRRALDGQVLVHRPLTDPLPGRNLGARFITWANLARVLRDESTRRGATVRHRAPVLGAEATRNSVHALLADDDPIEGDVLIGADGTRSTIRTVIDPAAPAPDYCGSRTIYGHTPRPPTHTPPAPAQLRSYGGPKAWLAHIDDPDTGHTYWFTNIKTSELLPDPGPTTEDWRIELLQRWNDDDIPAGIIKMATRIRASDDRALHHLPRWHTDRLVVIGDAAHAAPPSTEQGGSMAIEDAAVLGRCLRDLPLHLALARFEQERRERVETIIAIATGHHTTTTGPEWSYHHHIEWTQRIVP
ncbi:2-polyprenyl-6-methoxyphenol hydroxylase-like FAD-dependent oxidoreductase [Amycolatopsis cihanbeyliensis]|uniref:2-polyprenyl-6-methoxyphenol hydroxylase-like FAD-dependent oxidoreductase n=2 Tax=Amycolatopsis cihanbeyliensis TaxID=1128664 RepID=A0A542DE61_AMYCI|nr:2-polyprenyl-6-methoxyphenol hydroxylase-like FAD-dependent oxidoreductase [Amycolatopsis cihanbeyliensis]